MKNFLKVMLTRGQNIGAFFLKKLSQYLKQLLTLQQSTVSTIVHLNFVRLGCYDQCKEKLNQVAGYHMCINYDDENYLYYINENVLVRYCVR